MDKTLAKCAIDVVNMFDQANTNGVVDHVGNGRGLLLRNAINELRRKLNENGKVTWLDEEEANHD